jgi:hypothetical protein
MSLPDPNLNYILDGLRHRLWIFPALKFARGGFASERWIYVVGEAPYVVTFTVHAGRYPEGHESNNIAPSGLMQGWHRSGEGDHPCVFLDGAGCANDGSGLDAEDWYAAQPKGLGGFVADADVFTHVRDLYTLWRKP